MALIYNFTDIQGYNDLLPTQLVSTLNIHVYARPKKQYLYVNKMCTCKENLASV